MQKELPLLVKEKVEYYYNRQVWLSKIKLMHKEYNNKVKIMYSCYEKYITWRDYNREDTDKKIDRLICYLSESEYESMYFIPRSYIRQFKYYPNKSPSFLSHLPQRYVYTSGLNETRGYK
ncbi:MAG: hypothetical protein WD512_03300 [Candidatus Paceibacterota bacterium]